MATTVETPDPAGPDGGVVAAVDALADGDGRPVLDWLARRLVDRGHLAQDDLDELGQIELWNAEDQPPAVPDRDDAPTTTIDRPDKARALVDRAYAAAFGVPYAVPLLTLYLRHECEQAWEVSWLHGPIRLTIDAARTAWSRRPAGIGLADEEATTAVLSAMAVLDLELRVETAAASASPVRQARLAEATDAAAKALQDEAERALGRVADGPARRVLEHVRDGGEWEERYYGAVATAARAFAHHFTGADDLDAAIRALETVEDDRPVDGDDPLIDEVDRSELRAHRISLQALAAARDRPRLHVEHGKVVYLYPFGLRGKDAPYPVDGLVEKFRAGGTRWSLAGVPVRRVRRNLLLNDIWKGDDPHRREHRGAEAMLPDLLVPDPDTGEEIRLSVELRLCELGNHHLRLTTPLTGAGPLALYAATLRAAPEFGDLRELDLPVRADEPGSPEWANLAHFGEKVIGDVAGRLTEEVGSEIEHSGRPGLYHVMVVVQRASAETPGGTREPVARGEDLRRLLGVQPLWHPVRHGVSAIGEWVRYPVDRRLTVRHPAFTGDLLVRTANSTLLGVLGSPSYMIDALVESAEFVATLDGLFAAWQQELSAYYGKIRDPLDAMIEHGARDAADLATVQAGLQDLEQKQLLLHQFVMDSRRTLMFLTSPSLVTSPVMRVTLDRLLDAAGFGRLRGEFEGMVEEVLGGRLGALVEASVRRRQEIHEARAQEQRAAELEAQQRVAELEALERAAERAAEESYRGEVEAREQRQRRRLEAILAAIAGFGFAGVFQLVQGGLEKNMVVAAGFALATLLFSVFAGLFAFGAIVINTDRLRLGRRSKGAADGPRGADDGGRAGGPAP